MFINILILLFQLHHLQIKTEMYLDFLSCSNCLIHFAWARNNDQLGQWKLKNVSYYIVCMWYRSWKLFMYTGTCIVYCIDHSWCTELEFETRIRSKYAPKENTAICLDVRMTDCTSIKYGIQKRLCLSYFRAHIDS